MGGAHHRLQLVIVERRDQRRAQHADRHPGAAQAAYRFQPPLRARREDIPALVERFGILPVVSNEASWESFRGRYVCVAIPYGGGTTDGSLGF